MHQMSRYSPVLTCVCLVSLENVLCDVKELQRGMELTWREFSVQHNATLKDFISRNESRLNKLQEDARIAQVRTCTQERHRHLFQY